MAAGPSAALRLRVRRQPKAPCAVIVGEPDQPLGNLLVVRVVLGSIAVARLADPEDLTGQSNRVASGVHSDVGHRTPA